MTGNLEEYKRKRDFSRTPEPDPDEGKPGERPVFVVQKHDARRLHYDFRLEVDGVLKSWAVPKGPSTDPGEKRLAVPTEDHSLGYRGFEGIIPEGEYGAGVVLVWDRGPYRNLREGEMSLAESIMDGKVEIWLEGEKLKGGYALIRTGKGEKSRWLLIKMKDEKADTRADILATAPDSVISGRSIEEIRKGSGG
jgi:DNA ligase D-like protein (predicted 3'-phosphoesterase)